MQTQHEFNVKFLLSLTVAVFFHRFYTMHIEERTGEEVGECTEGNYENCIDDAGTDGADTDGAGTDDDTGTGAHCPTLSTFTSLTSLSDYLNYSGNDVD